MQLNIFHISVLFVYYCAKDIIIGKSVIWTSIFVYLLLFFISIDHNSGG